MASAEVISDDVAAYLQHHERRGLLRFITCGSVDDGKSTLIGRLLFEAGLLFEDQLHALEIDSRSLGTQGEELDFALLLDGLQAEREQGITIDVAYRYFQTERRKFIVADTPGHEQYTRNMVTGASTADCAVLLLDARKGLPDADATPHVPGLAARAAQRRARGQQARPRRLLPRAVRRARGRIPGVRAGARPRGRSMYPGLGAARRRRRRGEPSDALVRGANPARVPRKPSRSTRTGFSLRRSGCRCSGSTAQILTSAGSRV